MNETIKSRWIHLVGLLVHDTSNIWWRNIWPIYNIENERVFVAIECAHSRSIFDSEHSILILFVGLANKELVAEKEAIRVVLDSIE
jgi:hypothetical protein